MVGDSPRREEPSRGGTAPPRPSTSASRRCLPDLNRRLPLRSCGWSLLGQVRVLRGRLGGSELHSKARAACPSCAARPPELGRALRACAACLQRRSCSSPESGGGGARRSWVPGALCPRQERGRRPSVTQPAHPPPRAHSLAFSCATLRLRSAVRWSASCCVQHAGLQPKTRATGGGAPSQPLTLRSPACSAKEAHPPS